MNNQSLTNIELVYIKITENHIRAIIYFIKKLEKINGQTYIPMLVLK